MSTLDWPPRLTIEVAPVLRLFTGENFYSSADAALREAVLNAIDAIGRRQEVEPTLIPEIEVTFDRSRNILSVSDNGDGMNERDIATLFTKVGATASQFVRSGEQRYRSIGEFGIGALSYFLVSDEYQVDTLKFGCDALSLKFSSTMLDGTSQAQQLPATRSKVGTTLTLFAKSEELLDQLQRRFSYWIRNVTGLRAYAVPGDLELNQGGLTRKVRKIEDIVNPEWIEESDLGPPEDLDIWDQYDGKGRIDVLYRGVFVERLEVDRLWGIEGAIHVDPKHFRPKLNREGFVGDKLRAEVTPFLEQVHPAILKEAVKCISSLIRERGDWNMRKAISLWLAVPRSERYSGASYVWDAEFRGRKTFRVLLREVEQEMSVAELIEARGARICLAPDNIDQSDAVVAQAIRVLRAQGEIVVQGLQRQDGYMPAAAMVANSTAWLLLHTFRSELPEIVDVNSIAETVVAQQSVADVYSSSPTVKLLRLGAVAAPFVAVKGEVWINMENEAGRRILLEICDRNEGYLGLWVACMKFAPDQSQGLAQVGSLLRRIDVSQQQRLGLVRRQFLRGLVA